MPLFHRDAVVTETGVTTPPTVATPVEEPALKPRRTRTGAAWLATVVGAIVLIALAIFIAQNTVRVPVTFLWLHGRFPLAVALLVAAVGAALIVLILGTARITQLRLAARRLRRPHQA